MAGLAIFFFNILLDKYRTPDLSVDLSCYPSPVKIDLEVFGFEHPYYSSEVSSFKIEYEVHRVPIKNTSNYAAKNCKGVLKINGTENKICWNIPSERYKMTINSKSTEYLDVCAILIGDRSIVFDELWNRLTKLKNHARSTNQTEWQLPGLKMEDQIRGIYKSAEDIPIIIAPTEDGWKSPPYVNRQITHGLVEIMVTSQNAKSTLSKSAKILEQPNEDKKLISFD